MGEEGDAYLLPSLLYRVHETVEMRRKRLQACGIQEEAALRRGVRGGARTRTAGLGEGDLLVLAEELDFTLGETELRVGDGGGHLS
jgi:hypothetical protein